MTSLLRAALIPIGRTNNAVGYMIWNEQGMDKATKHTPEQIVNILRKNEVAVANGKTHPLASPEVGITEQTYYRWPKDYGGMKVNQAKQLKKLEQESRKLKCLVAELSLYKEILQDITRRNF